MADELKQQSLHIVVFPWLAFGHLLPFLDLSKHLAQRSHRVSFVSTPRNLQRLPKVPINSNINFVELQFPENVKTNLPNNAESTLDLQYNQIQYLKIAFDALADPLSKFLSSSPPDWLIYDFASHWLPPIAAELGVPCAFFNIFNAAATAFFGPPSLVINGGDARTAPEDFTVPPHWINFESNLAFRLHEVLKVFDSFEGNASGVTDSYRLATAIQGCDVMAVRSCDEFEGEFLRLSEEISNKPVLPLGLLPPPDLAGDERDEDDTWVSIRHWLDKQTPTSVVYVAFGSEAKLSQEEITELALGLESSGLPFFWVLRINNSNSSEQLPLITLPEGFEERVSARGIVFKGWAPQLRILAHSSIGGFLNHSGWSSVIEALANGLAMVVLPLVSLQGLVARAVVWNKVGSEIERDERDGSFTREAVAAALRHVMVDQQGEVLRANAKKLRQVFGDNVLHDRYMDRFERYIKDRAR